MAQVQTRDPAETYEDYLVPNLFAPWTEALLTRAAPRPGERVLDVACGTGIVARRVAPLLGQAGTVVGLDIGPAMLDVARAQAAAEELAIDWREGNALDLPFADGTFDLVLCQQGLQFFPDRPRAVREMRRVMADDGRAIIAVWGELKLHPVHRVLSDALERHLGTGIAAPFSLGRADEMRELLGGAGFGRIEVEPIAITVRFPEPGRFLKLSILGAAVVLPEFAKLDEAARDELVEAIRGDMDGVLREHTVGDALAFPTHALIATARA